MEPEANKEKAPAAGPGQYSSPLASLNPKKS
jgi:hypothetical protein